ncbi:ferrienterobactin-binding periplasmic protein [Escherichia coli]|uniref:Ferrienterobactin-binding periplasmic protein n=1 Tax=Escherichia coli TaxID=562 RepID=A0A2X1N0T6_ECOLX|nr:ferrienterobactin-binding periplasmic protein [Escherichia coli]
MASHYSCSPVIRKMPMLFYANPLLAHLPAVQNKQVYALGTETFRLDYYSAMQVLDRLKALF